jgi:branched-subunit amino acid aminotransferase/4-amino-4-deoxychorismate lyase
VLPGITRDSVLAFARDEQIPVREERLPRDVFMAADEAFLTSTSLPIAPIGSVNGTELRDAPGPITMQLMDRIAAARHGCDAARTGWLTYVR